MTGRLVKIEQQYERPSWTLIIHLETIQRDGTSQPIQARLGSALKQVNDPGHSTESIANNELGSFYEMSHAEDRGAGVFRFEGFTGNFVIHQGWNLEGITTGDQK